MLIWGPISNKIFRHPGFTKKFQTNGAQTKRFTIAWKLGGLADFSLGTSHFFLQLKVLILTHFDVWRLNLGSIHALSCFLFDSKALGKVVTVKFQRYWPIFCPKLTNMLHDSERLALGIEIKLVHHPVQRHSAKRLCARILGLLEASEVLNWQTGCFTQNLAFQNKKLMLMLLVLLLLLLMLLMIMARRMTMVMRFW